MAGSKKQRAQVAAAVARGTIGGTEPAPIQRVAHLDQGGPAPDLLDRVFPVAATLRTLPPGVEDPEAEPKPRRDLPATPPAPSPEEFTRRVDRQLARIPLVDEEPCAWQQEGLDVLRAFIDRGLHSQHIDAHLGRRIRECVLEVMGYGGLE